ncbi:uncharacterized protein LOC128221390 [Mya arenaria]|uniref:uncharacterized protein LOC128221390 n=1 Tax=Mya arenaria TaxID=6604 RepID=UPI0022E6CBE0|nr:uncharacterized protein LOC128221390 [Mya arenaria]
MDLHVMYAPIPDSTTPIKSEFGAPVSSNVTLTFYADAVPIPNASGYTWSRCINTTEGKQIANSSDVERSMVYKTLVENDKITIQSKGLVSKLTLHNITIIDYGEYKLTVQNGIGISWEQSYTIWREGRPSMPSEFAIVAGSATHFSVVVSWKGGSNGGSRQTFQVEYTIAEPNKEVFHVSVEDTEQENENATLTQLSSNTEYTVKMTSSNIHGTSGYTDEINFRTMQGPIKTYTRMASVTIMASSASGGALLLVSVVLLIVCIRRRKTSSDTTRSEQDVYSHYEIADRVNMGRMISAENHGTAGTGNGNGFNSSTNEQQDMYYLHPQHQQPYETPIDRQDIYSHYATADTTNMDKRSSSAKCLIDIAEEYAACERVTNDMQPIAKAVGIVEFKPSDIVDGKNI